MEMDEMRDREADFLKRIVDLEIKNNTLEANIHHDHKKLMVCTNT